MRRWGRLCIILAVASASCGGGKDQPVARKPPTPEAGADGGAATIVEGPPRRTPATAAKLAPVLQEIGVESVVPTSLVIQLAAPAVDQGTVGQTSEKSVLEITPEIPGRLAWSGISTLTFKPSRPFAFGTKYRAELKKIETATGIVEPAKGESWTREFTTPDFAFLSWSPTDIDLTKKTIAFELAFSGPVQANRAKPFLGFAIAGKAIAKVEVAQTREPNVLSAILVDPRIVAGATIKLAVKKDLPAVIDARAPAGGAEHMVSADKAISIKGVAVKEGVAGFYIEVVCDDAAAKDGDRNYYDSDEGMGIDVYDLSQRCELRDDAVARIRFKPEVKKIYTTPGKAGFRIFGDFKRGTYAMTLPGGSASVDGGVLLAPYRKSVSVPARKPQLSFAGTGRYLPRTAWSNLGIKHINVDEVNLLVRHIPPENLIFWLGNEDSEEADERTSNLILKQTIPLRGENDTPSTTWVDVSSLLPATTKGVLELKLAAVGAGAASRLLLTNLSLVAKKSAPPREPWNQQVTVWALDMDSTALLDGVDVTLVRKSGKTVARCATKGAQGCVLALPPGDEDIDHSEPFAIIARRGDDLTYIRYKDLRTETTDSNVSGVPYQMENPYHGTIWPDRGVYRPGETAHVVALVRDKREQAPQNPLPVDGKLIDPRAKVVRRFALKTNGAGMVVFDHSFPAFADTGHYRVELAVADKTIADVALQVEEFVPERMKVVAKARKAGYLPTDEVQIDVDAKYLFGGSAAGSPAELVCSLEPERFDPDLNGDFTYGVEPKGKPVALGDEKGNLDEKGVGSITCPSMDAATAFTQTGLLSARVGVLEAGSGRATTRVATTLIHPEKYYLGLKTGAEKAFSGKPFTVTGLVVDWDGKPAPAAVKEVTLEQLHLEAEYDYGYDEDEGEESYERNVHPVSEGKVKVPVVDGKFSFDVTPGDASVGYMVRVSAGRATTELELEGEYPYYYERSGERVDQTPRPARPARLVLDTPKAIKVGEPMTVKVQAPYRGKVLFTVETDRVVASEWKDVAGGEVTWSWKPETFAPNVYLSAFLVKDPHVESKDAFLPARAFGVASLRMEPTELTQTVKLSAPESLRSSSKLTVNLQVTPADGPTFATVAVVDEGILSLTDFATPDPLAALLPRRALGVETYETVGWTMLHAPSGTSSKSGGGDDEDAEEGGDLESGRVQPVKPVALFSGPVEVKDGKAAVSFDLPAYRGQLRVMAFTASAQRVGRAEAKVTVKDPLVVQVTFPRFAAQDDEMEIPVFLTNMSGGTLDVSLALSGAVLPVKGMTMPKDAPPPLAFIGKDKGTVTSLADGESRTAVFHVKAAVPTGAARLTVAATARGKGGSLDVKDEVDVPFLPSGPRERIVQKLKVEQGKTDVAATLRGWVPMSEKSTFWLTANPYGESFDHLKYLIHYPYGCVEQTTSSTRPLLFVSQLVEQIDPEIADTAIEDMVLAGVNRLMSMQTPSGGLGYWPGDSEPNDWGTAYATHMLLDIKALGYPVPEDRLKEILGWIDERVGQLERGEGIDRHYYDKQAEPYLHFVLAKAGKGKKARIARLIDKLPAQLTAERAEDAYMLKAALYLAGDRRYEKDLRTPDISPILEDRRNSWSFYSDRRRRGFMLSTYYDLFGRTAEGEALAQRVASGIADHASRYYTTQELVWGVTGLGKWVTGAAHDFEPGKLVADGKTIEPRPTKTKTSERTWALVRASEYKALALDLPKKGAGDLYLVASSEGVREAPTVKAGGEGITISRSYKTLAGDDVNLEDGSLKLGDLVFVELTIVNKTGEDIRNIALVDRLPAGLEIENARLGRGTNAEWIDADAQWQLDFLNMRDDRIEAFGALGPHDTKKVVYSVRAVTAGKFTLPPVEAEAMYDPSVWAREKGGTVVVSGPWAGMIIL